MKGVVPFAAAIAEAKLDASDPKEQAMIELTKNLKLAYGCLTNSSTPHPDLPTYARKVAALWLGLARVIGLKGDWRVKPKLHMWLEACGACTDPNSDDVCIGNTGCPTLTWTYRSEDFGGSTARQAWRRGGPLSVYRLGRSTIQKFCAQHPVPYITRKFISGKSGGRFSLFPRARFFD